MARGRARNFKRTSAAFPRLVTQPQPCGVLQFWRLRSNSAAGLQTWQPRRESQDEEDFVPAGKSEKETAPKRVICNILKEGRSNIPAWRSYLRRVPEGVVRRLGTPSEKPILRLTANVCALALNAASEFQSLKTDNMIKMKECR